MAGSEEWEVNFQRVTIKTSDGSLFSGRLNIKGFERLSDFLRHTDEQFIGLVVDEEEKQRTVMVNTSYIVWAEAFPAFTS